MNPYNWAFVLMVMMIILIIFALLGEWMISTQSRIQVEEKKE